MGCDIHAAVEYREHSHWEVFAREVELPRSYRTFGALAGVRDSEVEPAIQPRGLPADLNPSWLRQGDDDNPLLGDHSFSWLTTAEFEEALSRVDALPEYRAVLAAMRTLEESGLPARLVFGFDN